MGPQTQLVDISRTESTTLADLLSNSIVLQQTAPHLPLSSLYALAATCKSLHYIVYNYAEAFRYLDLSTLTPSALAYEQYNLDSSGRPVDAYGRDEDLDTTKSLTEDDIYAGPLHNVFAKLHRRGLLQHVRTLILDGLSVTAELVHAIITDERFDVRLLSIRECKNMNESKLQQVLRYAVRPSRAEGAPRIKGIYIFGPAERSTPELNARLSQTADRWYENSGRMLHNNHSPGWAEALRACEGIIAFDAVLCRGPRHDPSIPDREKYLAPALASVALGPAGCDSCHSSPEGPARYGESPNSHLPLLSPPPRHRSTLQAAQQPQMAGRSQAPYLFARCTQCLKGRWCERCHKWWDEDCYTAATIAQRLELTETELVEIEEKKDGGINLICKETTKVIGVRRDCFGCGHTCISCKEITIRKCVKCKNEYCLEDNEKSSATKCDWCNYTGRRTAELY